MSTLLVAATGGHLAQLHHLRSRLVPAGDDVVWATFDGPQSRSLLVNEDVEYVPYVEPRDYRTLLRMLPRARRILREHQVERVFSTGSGVALAFLPLARARGLAVHYIESAARSQGPSTTGRILHHVPGIQLSTQYATLVGGRWGRSVSVFDDFVPAPEDRLRRPVTRVVVTLGTIEGYGFRTLLERLAVVIPPSVEVVWQTGDTDVSGLDLTARRTMPQLELHGAMAAADVVVAHAGIGSALSALQVGHMPVLVPRRVARAEHVDDHQVQIARELSSRGLALHREVEDLTWADLVTASRSPVDQVELGMSSPVMPPEMTGLPCTRNPHGGS